MNEKQVSAHVALAKELNADVEFYSPHLIDLQQPHTRDERYVIARGTGALEVRGKRIPFSQGDVLFVPAGAEHRFVDFSADFGAWVLFYGPEGGAANAS